MTRSAQLHGMPSDVTAEGGETHLDGSGCVAQSAEAGPHLFAGQSIKHAREYDPMRVPIGADQASKLKFNMFYKH